MSDVWLSIVMVVVFVLIGGVFSGAEIALVSLREGQVRAMAEQGRRGHAVQRLLSDPNRFLAAVQVGVTFAGFFSAAFGASTLSRAAGRAGWRAGDCPRASPARSPWSSSRSRSATCRWSSAS